MKSLLLPVILLLVIGCALMKPSSTSTVQTKHQITYKWSQIADQFNKKEVENILGIPTDIIYSEDTEIWKYEYDIARSYGTVSFRRSDNRVWFVSVQTILLVKDIQLPKLSDFVAATLRLRNLRSPIK